MGCLCAECGQLLPKRLGVVVRGKRVERGAAVVDLTPMGARIVERLAAADGPVKIAALADELYGHRTGERNENRMIAKTVCDIRPRLRDLGLAVLSAWGGGWYELAEAA